MTINRYKLHFSSPLHVSAGGFGLEHSATHIQSDKLYSAICTAAAELFSQSDLDTYFFDEIQPKIYISSAFPFYGTACFFPKPLSFQPSNVKTLEYAAQKKLKSVKYVSESILQDILQQPEQVAFGDKGDDKEEHDFINSACWSKTATERFVHEEETPRVVLDRISQASQIFFFAQVNFEKETGLHFMAHFENETAMQYFEAALSLLQDTGIGADRTVGKGLFELEKVGQITLPTASQANAILLLSNYIPTETEFAAMNLSESAYDIRNRGGWVFQHDYRRKTLRAFTEGSVLHTSNPLVNYRGQLLKVLEPSDVNTDSNIRLSHPIYRNFTAISIPFQL